MATYKIQAGDTLSSIAQKNNTTVDVLAKTNNISDPNKIYAGSDINIPDATPPAVTATNLPSSVSTNFIPGQQTPEQMQKAFSASGQTPVVSTPTPGAISTSDLSRASTLPDVTTYASSNTTGGSLSDTVSKVAGTTLDATGKAIDALQKQREDQIAADKAAAQTNVDTVTGQIQTKANSTAAVDALNTVNSKFNVDQTIAQLQDINQKIVGAQEALNMGLIYEQDRPIRMQLLTGRSASLQKQGLATIGALQATAQVLQGNIDLAKSYAETTITAINTDNTNSMNALNTLLDLYNKKLVSLTSDEKDIVDTRIKALTDQDAQLQKDKSDIQDLMVKYPSAFLAGGVTLLDTKETAIQKMLPKLSAIEMTKFNADIANTLKNTSTSTDKDGPAADKQQLLDLKSRGMTYQEALNAFSDTLSTSWINAVYRQDNTVSDTSSKNQITDQYYSQFLDENGKVKPGYTVSIDSKGNPVVSKDSSTGGNVFSRVWSAIFQ